MAVDRVERSLEMVLVQVARGDNLDIVEAQKFVRVTGPLHAPAKDADDDAARRGGGAGPTQGAGRDDGGGSEGETGGGEKAAAADA